MSIWDQWDQSATGPLQCTGCQDSFLSNQELQRHLDQRNCCGIADGTLASPDQKSDFEWEYEYSVTETESFYVTLDLPVPRSGANVEEGPKGGRLTKRKDRWLNSTHLPFMEDGCRKAHGDYSDEDEIDIAKQSKENSRIPPGKGASTPDRSKKVRNAHAVASAVDDERESDDEALAMKETGRRMSTSTKQGPKGNGAPVAQTDASVDAASPSADSKDVAHDIQILELHNKNPIIIYRNQQFRCDWAENIGTELLFIKHSDVSAKPEGHLPVVREMPGEVDLLAVSGVRVMGNPINIRAKQRVIEKGKGRAYKSTKKQASADPDRNGSSGRQESASQISGNATRYQSHQGRGR